MANEITAHCIPGVSLQVRVMQGATTVGSLVTMTESGTVLGYYTGDKPAGIADGDYTLVLICGGQAVGQSLARVRGGVFVDSAVAGDAMAMTAGAQAALVTAMQAGLLNEGDGQTILAAIVAAIGNTNVDQIALVAAIRADIERGGGMLALRPTLAQMEASTVLAKEATAAAIKAKTDALPAAPAAVGDIPAASTVAAAVRTNLATELGRMDAAVSTRAAPGAAMTLTTGERATLAADIEGRLLNEGDSQQFVAALVAAIGNINVDQAVLVAAIRADLERAGGMLAVLPASVRTNLATELARMDVAVSTREAESAAAARATTNQNEHDSTQTAIAAIAAIGDPFDKPVPGDYPPGSAGEALGKLVIGPPDEPAIVIPGAPVDTALCRVYGYFEDLANRKYQLSKVKITFTLINAQTVAAASERILSVSDVVCTVDEQGRLKGPMGDAWVDLQRNDLLTPTGTQYKVTVEGLSIKSKAITLSAETANLRTLLTAA